MTPAQHTTAASTELATSSPSPIEAELAALRAHAHAVLGTAAGTGTRYTDAEAALVLANNPSAARTVHVHRAIALALLAE